MMSPETMQLLGELKAGVEAIRVSMQEHRVTHADVESRLRSIEGGGNSERTPRKMLVQWGIPTGVVSLALAMLEAAKNILSR